MKMRHHADALAARVHRATKPLILSGGNRTPKLIGSSVLLGIGDEYLLLSARHVLDEFAGGLPINVVSPILERGTRAKPLETRARRTFPKTHLA
jgi:hypothetical protein